MIDDYTIRQAAKDALNSIPCGTDFHGYDFLEKCRFNLLTHGSTARPYDSTLLRELRRYRELYGITLKDQNKSIYHKGDKQGCLPLG